MKEKHVFNDLVSNFFQFKFSFKLYYDILQIQISEIKF